MKHKYFMYPTEHLIDKVNKICESSYLDSKMYATLREILVLRLKAVMYRNRNGIGLKSMLLLENSYYCDTSQMKHIYADFELYWYDKTRKRLDNGILFVDYDLSEARYSDVSRFYKNLQKRIQTAVNKLDKCWGWYGVVGYGLNYGSNHIETNHTTSKQMTMMAERIRELQADKGFLLDELKEK